MEAYVGVRFSWLKPISGHEWRQKRHGRGTQRLVPLSGAIGSKTPGRVREYLPPPGLFRKFATLNTAGGELVQAEVRAFADEYGDIIAQPQEGTITWTTGITGREITRKHATFETWCRTIQHMRRAVDLWDRINEPKRLEDLKQLFSLPKGASAVIYRRVHHPLERKQGDTTYPAIVMGKKIAAYPVEDLHRLARKALQFEIQDALTDTETPSHTTPCLMAPEMQLVLGPVNLLANMWLTFARVVSGEIEERRCEMFDRCHEYIYIGRGPGLHRDDNTTCGAACRQRKKRKRAGKTS